MRRRFTIVLAGAVLVSGAGVLIDVNPGAAGQTCAGPGTGESVPTEFTDQDSGDVDGNGVADDIYLVPGDQGPRTIVVLDNGYTAGFDHFSSFPQLGHSVPAVHDVDRDGDVEIFVNPLDFQLDGSLDLLVLADCELLDASAVDGGPGLFITGGFGTQVGVDCLAPSAAGRGVTQYASELVSGGQSQNHIREEWRLVVDDAAGTVSWTRTLLETVTGDQFADTSVPDIFPAAQEEYRYDRPFECRPDPTCQGAPAILGTPYADTAKGTSGADVFALGAGDDRVNTGGGNDVVCGGAGNDVIKLAAGNDAGHGQGGDDTIIGGKGTDRGVGGPGSNDVCRTERRRSCEG